MIVSAIVARAANGVIGSNNQIPWYLPADLAYFKRVTLGHCVIMGRKSYASIGRPLPKRTNIVITRNPFFLGDGIVVVHSLEEALDHARLLGEEEAFVIGGAEIYRQSMPLLDRLYLTEVEASPEGDVVFPEFDEQEWEERSSDRREADEKNPFACTFRVLERRAE